MQLLVAEADASLAEFLQTRLQQEHFAVQLASTGDQISKFGEKSLFDLILLDLNLPGVPGTDYLRHLQSRWPEAPVALLSSASSVEERIKGLDAGADDIIMKPFAWSELAARIRAVLRRRNRPAREVFQFEDLEVNRVSHEVRRAGRAVELSPAGIPAAESRPSGHARRNHRRSLADSRRLHHQRGGRVHQLPPAQN